MSDSNDNKNQPKAKKSMLKIAITIAICVAVIIGAGALVKNAASISRLKSQLNESDQKLSQQAEENSSLKAILDSEDKDTYMEDKAREEDYIKDGEIKLHDIGSNE